MEDTPSGLPPHVLKLKIDCPMILLQNIDPAYGLCNRTRLEQHARKRMFLPQIPLCPSDDEMFPFLFKRKQFPVRLSFPMTINVGVYLPDLVLSRSAIRRAV